MERLVRHGRQALNGGPGDRRAIVRTMVTRLSGGVRHRAGRLLDRAALKPADSKPDQSGKAAWHQAQTAAGEAYRMQPYFGRVLVIRATLLSSEEAGLYELTQAWGWENLALGPFEIHDFACDHMDLLREPVLAEVAARTAQSLRAADDAIA
jgi:thioesterase domain-containing protein